jgi:hypothetical protein
VSTTSTPNQYIVTLGGGQHVVVNANSGSSDMVLNFTGNSGKATIQHA